MFTQGDLVRVLQMPWEEVHRHGELYLTKYKLYGCADLSVAKRYVSHIFGALYVGQILQVLDDTYSSGYQSKWCDSLVRLGGYIWYPEEYLELVFTT